MPPFPAPAGTIDLGSGKFKDFPVKIVSKDAGIAPCNWSDDSRQLHYTLGNPHYSINLEERFEFIANKPDRPSGSRKGNGYRAGTAWPTNLPG